MSQIRPQILMRYGRQNQPVRVPVENMIVDPVAQSYIAVDANSGASSITVQNATNFAAGFIIIGDFGNQNSEILRVTSISGNVLSLFTNTVYAHTNNTPVTTLYYDQVQIYNAPTTTGSKTQLGSNINIPANQQITEYNDLAASTGYYFARWINSNTSAVSDYSEPSPVGGYTLLSARNIIDAALSRINKQTSSVLTDEFAFQMIDACQTEVLREFKRWSFMQSFNTIIGQTATGTWKIQAPANLDDNLTYKSIWNIRVGREFDMIWIDKSEFDALVQGVGYSTVSVQGNISDTTLTLVSTADFTHQQGSVQVGPNVYTFTANNTATGVLTLGSPLIAAVPVNQDVFQFASLGYPTYWTIWQGYIYHWPITGTPYEGRNYWMDYYIKQIQITTDDQQIVLPDPVAVQYYLAEQFLLKLNNGEETPPSASLHVKFLDRVLKMKNKESTNRNFILSPDLGGGNGVNF